MRVWFVAEMLLLNDWPFSAESLGGRGRCDRRSWSWREVPHSEWEKFCIVPFIVDWSSLQHLCAVERSAVGRICNGWFCSSAGSGILQIGR